jgi:hypothetical protein
MKYLKNSLIILSIIILLIGFAEAKPSYELKINANSFYVSSVVDVNAKIFNDSDQNVFILTVLTNPNQSSGSKSLQINAGEEETINLFNLNIDESYENGDYHLETQLVYLDEISPTIHEIISSKSLSFSVSGAPENFTVKVQACRDEKCKFNEKIFNFGDLVHLNYTSNLENIKVESILIYPSNREEKIELPKNIELYEEGKYTLKVTASSEGFNTTTDEYIFAVTNIDQTALEEIRFEENLSDFNKNSNNIQPKVAPINSINITIILGVLFAILIIAIIAQSIKWSKERQNQ